MANMTVVLIKRNATFEQGMYGLSIHDEPGGAANVQPIKDESELMARLKEFGVTQEHAQDVLTRLKEKHQSVQIEVTQDKLRRS
jgi:hypothetical protein